MHKVPVAGTHNKTILKTLFNVLWLDVRLLALAHRYHFAGAGKVIAMGKGAKTPRLLGNLQVNSLRAQELLDC
jgi:hypothetical protein